ncbi:MAG: hypothetical protein ACTSRA_15210 [Promethearchaeota archaeon]
MNRYKMAQLLFKDDVLFIIEEIIKENKKKKEIVEKMGLYRRTLYNLQDTRNIKLETKLKMIKFMLKEHRDEIYSYLQRKLEFYLSDLILNVLTNKFPLVMENQQDVEKSQVLEEIQVYLKNYQGLLKRNVRDRFDIFFQRFLKLLTK